MGRAASACYSDLAYLDVEQRRFRAAEHVLDESLPFSTERDIPICRHWQTGVRSRLHLSNGHWGAALEDAEQVLEGRGMPLATLWPHLVLRSFRCVAVTRRPDRPVRGRLGAGRTPRRAAAPVGGAVHAGRTHVDDRAAGTAGHRRRRFGTRSTRSAPPGIGLGRQVISPGGWPGSACWRNPRPSPSRSWTHPRRTPPEAAAWWHRLGIRSPRPWRGVTHRTGATAPVGWSCSTNWVPPGPLDRQRVPPVRDGVVRCAPKTAGQHQGESGRLADEPPTRTWRNWSPAASPTPKSLPGCTSRRRQPTIMCRRS